MNSTTFPFSLYALLDFEIYIFLLIFTFISYLFYKLLLKNASPERHTNITNHLKNLFLHAALLSFFYFLFNLLSSAESDLLIKKALPYLSTVTYLWGCLFFVKTARLLVLQYLFLGSMRTGVPVLFSEYFFALTFNSHFILVGLKSIWSPTDATARDVRSLFDCAGSRFTRHAREFICGDFITNRQNF